MKLRLYISMLLIGFTIGGCQIEEPFSKEDTIIEGLSVTLQLPFCHSASEIVTRAEQSPEMENRVNNAYLLIFDEVGNRLDGRYCTVGDGMVQLTDSTGRLEIKTTTQNRARIVGIANLNDGKVTTAYDVTPDMLDEITTYSQLCLLQTKLNERSVQRGSTFLMTGFAKDENGSEWVQIPGVEGGTATLNAKLRFERTDAKVKFVVKVGTPAESYYKELSFKPLDWRVCKVPAQVLVMKDLAGGDADGAGCEYFASSRVTFEQVERDASTALYNGGSFIFYMPENKKSPTNLISTAGLTSNQAYALREKQEKTPLSESIAGRPGQSEVNGAYLYAPENATYVEMRGTLSYNYTGPEDGREYYVEGDVTYIVHLGYSSGDPNDYTTDRNTNYTYNVTIKGVNDIVVEVTNSPDNEGEVRPSVVGDVMYSTDGVYQLDAHYDRRLISISLSQIPDIVGGVTWGVRTPFGDGIYDLENPGVFTGIEDYKWVKFAINSDYGVPDNQYVKYPGDQNYDDPMIDSDGLPPGSQGNYSGDYASARLLDAYQLVERVNKMKEEGKTGTIGVTAFIDEYVYHRDPVTYKEDISLWRKSVDQPDRMLYLFVVPDNSKYSPDGESLVINSLYTFRQKSLRSIYNLDHADLINDPDPNDNYCGLWGLESVMETERLETGGSLLSNGTSRSNGRFNTLRSILGVNYDYVLHWTDVLNTSAHYELNSGYKNALYACLMRNRDLNGDNIVDPEEIRWYLASVNQLVDIYIGEYSLDMEARLYPENSVDRPGANGLYWHYTTSSYVNNNPEVLWAEEGAALGTYWASQQRNGSLYSYRCVRNLGIELDDIDTEPLPIYTYTNNPDGTYTIDASRLTANARRENFETGYLPAHTNLDISCLPYNKFEVLGNSHEDDYPVYRFNRPYVDLTWEEALQSEDMGELKEGYRMPNYRELLIMLNILPSDAWPSRTLYGKKTYLCKTSFSRAGMGHFSNKRNTFRMNPSNNSVGVVNDNSDNEGYIRAVRDVK